MLELYVEDKLCDLSGREKISVDYAIAKIGQLNVRSGARSAQISLLKTNVNLANFEVPDDINSASRFPYRRLKCRLFSNGIDLKIRFVTIESITETINIRLYDSQVNFYTQIKDVLLSEMTDCRFNHFWERLNVLFSCSNTSGYIYPIINYHSDAPNAVIDNIDRKIDIRYMHPALFYDEIVQLIVEYVGYSLTNRILENEIYKMNKLLLVYGGDELLRTGGEIFYKVKAETTSPQAIQYNIFNQTYFDFHSLTQSCSYWILNQTAKPGQLLFQDIVTIKGKVFWQITNNSGSPVVCNFRIATNVGSPQVDIPMTLAVGLNTIDYDFEVHNDDSIKFIYFYFQTGGGTPSMTVESGSYIDVAEVEVTKQVEYVYNDIDPTYVTATSIFGKLEMVDAISNYLKLFCGLIYVNEDTKAVDIFTFNDIINNISNCLDWSSKIDLSESSELSFSLDIYGRKNTLTYKENGDEQKPEGADGEIDIDDENLEREKSFVEVDYSATNTEVLLDDLNVPTIPVYKDLTKTSKANPRVLLLSPKDSGDLNPTGQMTYTDGSVDSNLTIQIPIARFIDVDEEYNLGFDNSLIEKFYRPVKDILTNLKVVVIPIRLNDSDINQLDYRKPVYIKHLNAYFYVSQVKEYNPGTAQSTLVELVKLF